MVAREAGVSKATISNYLNKKTTRLSAETSRKIEEVVRKLHYIPNFGARRIIHNRSSADKICTIGIILEDASIQSMFSNRFYGLVHSGISDSFKARHYRTLMIPSLYTRAAENAEYLKELSRGFVDAYMLFNIHEQDHYVETFKTHNIPFMCFGDMRRQGTNNFVGTDHTRGVRNAVEHFFSHDIYDIAVIIGTSGTIVGSQMKDGYIEAFTHNHIPFDEKRIVEKVDLDNESAYDICMELLNAKDPPKAFILTELHYYGLVKAAAELKVKLYEDVKVIVMSYYPAVTDSAITHFRVSRYMVGKTAAEKLIDLIDGKKIEPYLFPMEFVVGNSCGCAGK
jgi:DNA-binding LacI/PurR family transcriptional regulator